MVPFRLLRQIFPCLPACKIAVGLARRFISRVALSSDCAMGVLLKKRFTVRHLRLENTVAQSLLFPTSADIWGSKENTLRILYQAQSQNEQHRPCDTFSPSGSADYLPTIPSAPSPQPSPVQNQPSLHSFWKVPSTQSPQHMSPSKTPLVVALPSAPGTLNQSANCEDCGVGLSEEDAMMDDGYGFEAYINTCSACSRAVCFSCSISNLGEQRRCLICAGKKRSGTNKNRKLEESRGWTLEGVIAC